jgi:hypothetical protein
MAFLVSSVTGQSPFHWSFAAGSESLEHGKTLCIDESGNSYVGGKWKGSTANPSRLGEHLLEKDKEFIAKFSPLGEVMWAQSINAGHLTELNDLFYDSGFIYGIGEYNDYVTMGGTTLMPRGTNDIFFFKMDPDGRTEWIKSIGNNTGDAGRAIAVKGGKVYVTGMSRYTIYFSEEDSLVDTSRFELQADYIASFNTDGSYNWARRWGNAGDKGTNNLAIDTEGNIYVCGHFAGYVEIDTFRLSNGNKSGYLAKFSPQGEILWAKHPSLTSQGSEAVDFLPGGNFITTGNKSGDSILLTRFNSSGDEVWIKQFGVTDITQVRDMCTDSLGNIFLVGTASDSAHRPKYKTKCLIAAFDSSGNNLWVHTTSNAYDTTSRTNELVAVATDSKSLYFTGHFTEQISFYPFYHEAQREDLIVGRMTTFGEVPWASAEENFMFSDGFRFFPNPANRNITLKFKKAASRSITLYNMQGAAVLETEAEAQALDIDVSKLRRGTYIIRAISDSQTHSSRVLID